MTDELYRLITDKEKSLKDFTLDVYEIVRSTDEVSLRLDDNFPTQGGFIEEINSIKVNLPMMKNCLVKNSIIAPPSMEEYLSDETKFVQDMAIKLHIIAVLLHENEHVKQSLISKGIINSDYEFYDQVCKDIYRRFYTPSPMMIFYDKFRHDDLYFERNASLEAYKICYELAKMLEIDGLENLYQRLISNYMLDGYLKIDRKNNSTPVTEGSIKKTYKMMFKSKLYETLDIPKDLPFEEKVKYGVELTNEELMVLIETIQQKTPSKQR